MARATRGKTRASSASSADVAEPEAAEQIDKENEKSVVEGEEDTYEVVGGDVEILINNIESAFAKYRTGAFDTSDRFVASAPAPSLAYLNCNT